MPKREDHAVHGDCKQANLSWANAENKELGDDDDDDRRTQTAEKPLATAHSWRRRPVAHLIPQIAQQA